MGYRQGHDEQVQEFQHYFKKMLDTVEFIKFARESCRKAFDDCESRLGMPNLTKELYERLT
jgi:hypothetical protein